ncbi:MAG TPA: hypothetical protein ENK44_04555 [Caldithrix abyssi]|uniref:Cthe-2314-like HEPN domain-containing protein n=1 Tax=Caldithrix abyssi TaxID=187145 RepID=A0A7V4WUK5_CALAY|nr:hypothetical protein [Caldithrix abyssi]
MQLKIKLSDSEKKFVNSKLPELDKIYDTIISFNPDIISIALRTESTVPIASICLHDCLDTLEESKYALSWAYYYKIMYEKTNENFERMKIISHIKYFSDDVALRTYSSAEHLANSIVSMYQISKEKIKPYSKKGISLAIKVGKYLIDQNPNLPITKAIKELINSNDWCETIRYRNEWVHNQPLRINDQGFIYKRKSRWIKIKDGEKNIKLLHFGGNDEYDLTADELLGFVTSALHLITNTLKVTANEYRKLLESHGIKFTEKGISFKM